MDFFTQTFDTLDYLSQAGIEYIGDWVLDDESRLAEDETQARCGLSLGRIKNEVQHQSGRVSVVGRGLPQMMRQGHCLIVGLQSTASVASSDVD